MPKTLQEIIEQAQQEIIRKQRMLESKKQAQEEQDEKARKWIEDNVVKEQKWGKYSLSFSVLESTYINNVSGVNIYVLDNRVKMFVVFFFDFGEKIYSHRVKIDDDSGEYVMAGLQSFITGILEAAYDD
jgi:hypothetical protein